LPIFVLVSLICVLVVSFLLGCYPASAVYMPTFRSIVCIPSSQVGRYGVLHTYSPMKMKQSVPKRRHLKYRRREITQKNAYDIQNTANVLNQKCVPVFTVFCIVSFMYVYSNLFCLYWCKDCCTE
jgi:hypothetical protein